MRVLYESDWNSPPESDWTDADFSSFCFSVLLSDDGDYYHQIWGQTPTPLQLGPEPHCGGGGDRW